MKRVLLILLSVLLVSTAITYAQDDEGGFDFSDEVEQGDASDIIDIEPIAEIPGGEWTIVWSPFDMQCGGMPIPISVRNPTTIMVLKERTIDLGLTLTGPDGHTVHFDFMTTDEEGNGSYRAFDFDSFNAPLVWRMDFFPGSATEPAFMNGLLEGTFEQEGMVCNTLANFSLYHGDLVDQFLEGLPKVDREESEEFLDQLEADVAEAEEERDQFQEDLETEVEAGAEKGK